MRQVSDLSQPFNTSGLTDAPPRVRGAELPPPRSFEASEGIVRWECSFQLHVRAPDRPTPAPAPVPTPMRIAAAVGQGGTSRRLRTARAFHSQLLRWVDLRVQQARAPAADALASIGTPLQLRISGMQSMFIWLNRKS
jgi:hypothetical protein